MSRLISSRYFTFVSLCYILGNFFKSTWRFIKSVFGSSQCYIPGFFNYYILYLRNYLALLKNCVVSCLRHILNSLYYFFTHSHLYPIIAKIWSFLITFTHSDLLLFLVIFFIVNSPALKLFLWELLESWVWRVFLQRERICICSRHKIITTKCGFNHIFSLVVVVLIFKPQW